MQAKRLKDEASEAVCDKNYDTAIAALEQAVQLHPADRELPELLESARQKKRTSEQVDSYLRQADAARRTGDLTTAQAIVEKALELDHHSSRVRSAYAALARQAQEADQRSRVRSLLEAARGELQNRRFEPALDLLRQAEHIDASDPELHTLLHAVEVGIRQRERRLLLDRLETCMAAATTTQAVEEALHLVDEGLARFPTDATLLKCRSQLDRQLREDSVKRRVEETVQQCRAKLDSAPAEALEIVRSQLEQIPGNERLLALQARIEQRMATVNSETVRTRYLQDARDALHAADYAKAVAILEACPGEMASPEIKDLLNFARQEATLAERQALVSKTLARASHCLREGRFEEAIQLLQSLNPTAEEAGARELLEQAYRQRDSRLHKTSDGAQTLEACLHAGLYSEVIDMLTADTASPRSPAAESLLEQAKAKRAADADLLARLGRSYAALDGSAIPPEWRDTSAAFHARASDRVLNGLRLLLEARITAKADRSISAEFRSIRAELRAGEAAEAAKLVAESEATAQYASPEMQAEWKRLAEQVAGEKKKFSFRRPARS